MQIQLKRVVLALALSSVAGVAAAQTFTATATVQNAVSITETTPLTFGTLFATATGAGVAAPTTANSEKVTLTPAGVITRTAATVTPTPAVQPLGGAVAGVYTAPGLPSSSKVLVAILTNEDTPDDFENAALTCAYNTPEDARVDGQIVMTHSSGDPAVAFFCVNAFKSDVTALLDADGGTGYTLPFGVTALNFKLGATLVTQAPIGAAEPAHQFQAGVYTASFDMEVRFP